MDLSALGIVEKKHKVIPVMASSIIRDFNQGKLKVVGVECNTRGVYGSPVQKALLGLHPNMRSSVSVHDRAKIGHTDMWKAGGHRFIANMYISHGFGLGRGGGNSSKQPVNRFSPRYLTNAFDNMIKNCLDMNIPIDRTIGIQRIYGGLGGAPWSEVQDVLDACCAKHEISIYAYLPANYDTAYVRGT